MTDLERAGPRTVLAQILGAAIALAVAALLFAWARSGGFPWPLAGVAGALWGFRAFLTGLFDDVLSPLGRFAGEALAGSGPEIPGTRYTIDEETANLERFLEQSPPRHREILMGIRLAEIYRTHQHDVAKAAQLLARLRAKYPDAPELSHAGPD